MIIRPAREGEHSALTELSINSVQRRWGYSDEFMGWEPEAISVTADHISGAITHVLEDDGQLLGFYVLRWEPPELTLLRLMVSPESFGSGCGRILWDHAVKTARSLGATAIKFQADPNAEPFYRRMGAETVGEDAWEPPMMPGWRLKRMEYPINSGGAVSPSSDEGS
jgi:predicted N-acetyltransferase YhbS